MPKISRIRKPHNPGEIKTIAMGGDKHTDTRTDTTTYRLNQPSCRFSEKKITLFKFSLWSVECLQRTALLPAMNHCWPVIRRRTGGTLPTPADANGAKLPP